MDSRLTPLQERVLAVLAPIQPRWTLTGGGALAGVHLGHRATRDLDLFWHGQRELAGVEVDVVRRLQEAGLRVEVQQAAPAFSRLRVATTDESVEVDLVAEPVANIEPVLSVQRGTVTIQVDSIHEILVNKLCALLHRSEVRDLVDVHLLVTRGGDLMRALGDAPRKDGGFSPLMLAWLLRDFPVGELAEATGLDAAARAGLATFRDSLVELLLSLPPGS